jgi:hypothetical protein
MKASPAGTQGSQSPGLVPAVRSSGLLEVTDDAPRPCGTAPEDPRRFEVDFKEESGRKQRI